MDRLLDEEAAQEEADMKVFVMKGRLEALKKRREAARQRGRT
jgi:zinc finger protein 830